MNWRLAWHLAWQSLRRHPTVAFATILGITIAMLVVATILIVDHNSTDQPEPGEQLTKFPARADLPANCERAGSQPCPRILRVSFERGPATDKTATTTFPTQKGRMREGISERSLPMRRGEEDYQAMRLAVRLASLLAFSIGAVIVFYAIRFSVASRTRELSLLLCLGETRRNVAFSLLMEALLVGAISALFGLLLAFPAAAALLQAGISTTGRVPDQVFYVPWSELTGVAILSIAIAVLGVLGPIRSFYRWKIVEVLQPRFISAGPKPDSVPLQGFASLIPPLSVAAWLATRPFVKSWLSVVQFFLLESFFVALLTGAILWWIRPILRSVIQLVEIGIKPLLPLDSVLVGRRMRLTSHKVTFTVAGVTLVFSLLTALHDITGALKGEIHRWAEEALYPYVYLQRVPKVSLDQGALELALQHNGIQLFRMSAKARGEFPVRLIAAADINPYRTAAGKRPLVPNTTILSRTLAARFGVRPGDWLIIDTSAERHRFELIDVSDDVGFYAEDGQYVDLKSYVLFAEGNPLFFSTLERSLGRYAMARKTDGSGFSSQDIDALLPYYHLTRRGTNLGNWQKAEIDRDFLIFDFVLFTTVVLAAVGVANSILIQVLARERELAVLRTLGVSRLQTMRLLLIEGVVIGLVSAFLALILGNVIGAISISFLDRFTLFEYRFAFSLVDSAIISLLTVSTCTLAAIYPALVANRISSAESLHYE